MTKETTSAVRNRMADRLIRHTDRVVKRGLRTFKGEKDMEEMYLADQLDYLGIAMMIRKNHIAAAWECANRLDTAARDEIPATVWDWMYRVTEGA